MMKGQLIFVSSVLSRTSYLMQNWKQHR